MITCVHDGHGTQRDSEAKLIFIGCQKIYQTEPPYSYELSTPWCLGIVYCVFLQNECIIPRSQVSWEHAPSVTKQYKYQIKHWKTLSL